MRVIIAKDGKNITYEQVASCRIEKRCLTCVDEVFLDTREGDV